MAVVLAALAAVVEEAWEAPWERGARVAVVVTAAERAEDGQVMVPAAEILEGARVAACAALARAAAEGRAVAEYAGVAQRAMAARVVMAAWLEEVATACVDCAASLTLSYHPVVQAAREWRQRSRQRRSLPQRRPCSASGAVA